MANFRKFLLQQSVVVMAVGLVIALAFSTLVHDFTSDIITPLVNAIEGGHGAHAGLGVTVHGQRVQFGAFIGSIVYFVIFMAVVYTVLVVPYRRAMQRQGKTVFGDPPPTKACPECCSDDLPVAARRCLHCGVVLSSS
jgi:large conductance mechanosensitive channel